MSTKTSTVLARIRATRLLISEFSLKGTRGLSMAVFLAHSGQQQRKLIKPKACYSDLKLGPVRQCSVKNTIVFRENGI